jgi:acylphosphatase
MTADERLSARIVGQVQGVGYRWWARMRADELGLTGWVANDPDDRTVELVAEGQPAALDAFERMLRDGPAAARVERVDATREPASGGFQSFEITRP